MSKPFIICLIPVKNEAWILERCLAAASLWADKIIVADQMSTDGSREIALKYPKALLIDNNSIDYNEDARQKLLITEARKLCFEGKKLFITLDADECLTANFAETEEWKKLLKLAKGTVATFNWLNLHPDGKQCWQPSYRFPWGFMDDGITQHEGQSFHSSRIPLPENAPVFNCEEIKVLHYQFSDWERMQSKHRWYQCYELLNRPEMTPLSIFRMYHHMYGIQAIDFLPTNEKWFSFYEKQGIDMRSVQKDATYRWDSETTKLFDKYGEKYFSSLNIWQNSEPENDPRTKYQRTLHRYLLATQIYQNQATWIGRFVRLMDKFLKYTL